MKDLLNRKWLAAQFDAWNASFYFKAIRSRGGRAQAILLVHRMESGNMYVGVLISTVSSGSLVTGNREPLAFEMREPQGVYAD